MALRWRAHGTELPVMARYDASHLTLRSIGVFGVWFLLNIRTLIRGSSMSAQAQAWTQRS